MEDSSNGKVADEPKEVVEVSEKTIDIVDDDKSSEPESKKHSLLGDLVDEAKKILEDSSSSSSSSDSDNEEKEKKKKEKEKVEDVSEENKVESSFAEKLGINEIPAIVEGFVSNVEEKLKSKISGHHEHKEEAKQEEKHNDNEAPIQNIDQTSEDQIPQSTSNPGVNVSVTVDSLQTSSWKNCCGLFEVLRPYR